jgi:MFS family permease
VPSDNPAGQRSDAPGAVGRPTNTRWLVVAFAVSLAVLQYVDRVAISQAGPLIQKDLGLSATEMGWVFAAFTLAYALFEIPGGYLGDWIGPRKVILRIVLWWSFFTAATGWVLGFRSLVAVRFLFGAGEAGCFPNLTRMLSQWLPRGERVKAQALMWACTRWGGAVTPPLVLLAINFVGWRWAFVLFGLLGAAWVAWFSRRFHERPADHPGVNDAEQALLAESQALVAHAPESWVKLLLRPQAGTAPPEQRAQAEANQAVEVQRQNQLIAQQQAEVRNRQLQLARNIATTRARLASSGVAPDDGSAAAITTGLTGDAAAAANASDAVFRAQLASGRASLLNPATNATSFTRAGRSFGSALNNLLQ